MRRGAQTHVAQNNRNGDAGAGRLRRGFLGLAVSAVIAAIVVLAMDVRSQLDRLSTAAEDSVQFTLSQVETEAIRFARSVSRAQIDSESGIGAMRREFDLFYSRVNTLSESRALADLRRDPEIQKGISRLNTFLERWVPIIDGPDVALVAALPQLDAETGIVLQVTRETTLYGVSRFANTREARRVSVSDTLARIAGLSVFLVALLLVMIFALTRVSRIRQQVATDNREVRERLETIISSSLDAVIASDRFGRIVEYNGAAEEIFGYPRQEAIGASMAGLIIPEPYLARHKEGMARYMRGETGRMIGKGIVQLEARRQNGEVFPVDLSLASAQSPNGEIFVAFIRDISGRARAEAAVREARDRAIAGEKSKARLLAVMSHEMRTPLNGMLGTLELLRDSTMDDRSARFIKIIRASGRQLLKHVNDVLDISRLDAGKMPVRNRPFDLTASLQDLIDTQTNAAAEFGNTLLLVPPSPVLRSVYGDPDRLQQVLLNLVNNAIKFTRNGEITLEADCSEGLDAVEIRVTDTGIGIEDADIDRIFDDFDTLDSSYGRETSGTGLGLGISRRLVLAMGGELGAESVVGDGSVFWLRLPMSAPKGLDAGEPDQVVEPEDAPARTQPLDVLLVEDNAVNRMVARAMLERDGHRVSEAVDGKQGLEAAQAERFDVILMDISMPGLDGLSVTTALRASSGASATVPIVATTAHALPEEVAAFRSAGMSAVLVKPLSITSLRQTLSSVTGDGGASLDMGDRSSLTGEAIDAAQLASLRHDFPTEKLHEVFARFQSEMDAFFARPLPGASQPARQSMADEAHRLAGSAGVFGALTLAGHMREIQTLCVDAPDDQIDALRTRAARSYAEVCNSITRGLTEQG